MTVSLALRVCKPICPELVPKPRNKDGWGREGIRCKNTSWECMAGITLSVICVAAAGLLVVIQ